MRRTGLVCGAVLVALGALSISEAFRIRDDWQGAKLMPAVIGIVLAVLGAAHLRAPAVEVPAWPDGARRRRVLFVFGTLAVYAGALPSLGFLPATALFVLILLRALGSYSWATTIGLTAAIAIASHLVFKHWLGMPLPTGPFGA